MPSRSRPLYKVFATPANRYLYDTATNQILAIPEDFAGYLEEGVFTPDALDELADEAHGGRGAACSRGSTAACPAQGRAECPRQALRAAPLTLSLIHI